MCFKEGRYADAVHHCDRALRLSPGSHDALLVKSNALLELGHFPGALACIERSLEIKESNYMRVKKGTVLYCMRDYLGASRCFAKRYLDLSLIPHAIRCYANILFRFGEYYECLKVLSMGRHDERPKKLEKECRKRLGLVPKWMFWSRGPKTLRDLNPNYWG